MRWKFLLPQYWPAWLAIGLVWLFAALPYRVLLRLGAGLGWIARRVLWAQVRVVRTNLRLCLPELGEAERERILDEHFTSLGIAVCETALVWWAPAERIRALGRVEGLEHLDAALARGKGAILLAAHFTTLEITARLMTATRPTCAVYRETDNELIGVFLKWRRSAASKSAIPRDDIRAVVRALKGNETVWYAPDQAYRKKGAEMVPFFGIPVATNTATSRLAQMTGAAVLPYFAERLPRTGGYIVTISPPLADYPSGDSIADATRVHALIEAQVRRIPAQYLWVHKRLKGLRDTDPDYYRD
jgi:KDO2-lipid IV(A) lauroyltransferase